MRKKRKEIKESRHEKIEYEISSGNVFADFGFENPKEANAKVVRGSMAVPRM